MGKDKKDNNEWQWYEHKPTKVRARKGKKGDIQKTPWGKVWPWKEFMKIERKGKEWLNDMDEFGENYRPIDKQDDYD